MNDISKRILGEESKRVRENESERVKYTSLVTRLVSMTQQIVFRRSWLYCIVRKAVPLYYLLLNSQTRTLKIDLTSPFGLCFVTRLIYDNGGPYTKELVITKKLYGGRAIEFLANDMYNGQQVTDAIKQLKNGGPILIFDDDNREKETDLVIGSEFVTPDIIRTFRKDGGGLICTTVPPAFRAKLNLPYLSEIFYNNGHTQPVLQELVPNDIPYDEISTFSITINHRKTFTGITDNDRALTITEFAKLIPVVLDAPEASARKIFGEQFRSPGHVHLLNASEKLLVKRFGHTELSTAMVFMAELIGSATICEMMGDDGNSLKKESAKEYGETQNIPFVEGKDIIEAWKSWSK